MCIRRRQKNSFAVFSVMAASLYFAQRQQALKQNVIEHHNGCYRTEMDRSFVAIESGDIAFIEYNAAQADRACRQVDAQVVASDRADLTQLPCHYRGVGCQQVTLLAGLAYVSLTAN